MRNMNGYSTFISYRVLCADINVENKILDHEHSVQKAENYSVKKFGREYYTAVEK